MLAKSLAIFICLTPALFCQPVPNIAPVPENPLELASRGVQLVNSPGERDSLIGLLTRARAYYRLNDAGVAYELKTSFTVTSRGATEFDGDWEIDQIAAPGLGVHLTARTGGHVFEQLHTSNVAYQNTPSGSFPLRLHEAHGHLLGSLEAPSGIRHDMIRTVAATLNGASVTCVLLSAPTRSANVNAPGRLWQEREECLDPQTGHLLLHSPAPGLYVLYDYSQSYRLASRELPGKMTVIENDATVIEERIESLEHLAKVDPASFAPTAQMQADPRGAVMAGLKKISLWPDKPSAGDVHCVVVFGLLTPDGKITEVHALQSSDPSLNDAALRRVSQMTLQFPVAPAADREQHELFAVVHFTPGTL
jgi:hypothetical protein